MKLNVLFSPVSTDELYFADKTTVVIDVLRASSSIITALSNGASEIIPVATIEFAVKVSGGMFGGKSLLGGERNTKMIDGFAIGNSPLEYAQKLVENKYIVFFSTNGSKAIVKAKFSKNLFISSFNNLSAVAKHLIELNENVEILCAGNNNLFSLEDSVCSGMLINKMVKMNSKTELSDSSLAALAMYEKFGANIYEMLKNTEHGKKLIANGFEGDIEYCSRCDITNNIPYFKLNVLKLLVPGASGH